MKITAHSQVLDELTTLARGHQILLDRGLQIHAQVRTPQSFTDGLDLDRFAQSNFTGLKLPLNRLAPPNYDPAEYLGSPPGVTYWSRTINGAQLEEHEIPYLDNLVGLQLNDEQDITEPQVLAEAEAWVQEVHQNYPHVLAFLDQGGTRHTESELRAYMERVQPDMLMFNHYPSKTYLGLIPISVGATPSSRLYEIMIKYRHVALEGHPGSDYNPIPYGLYIQTFSGSGANSYETWREPSDSELRLNVFAPLAYGFTYLNAWFYNQFDNEKGLQSLLFDGPGDQNPTPMFDSLAATLGQVQNLGPSLVRLLSTDIRYIPNPNNLIGNLFNPTPRWDSDADPYITGIQAENLGEANFGQRGDVLIGYFNPLLESSDGPEYNSETYFMLVNGLSSPFHSSEQTQQLLTINFDFDDSGIDSLLRLNRHTGEVETVELTPLDDQSGSKYQLELTLGGGTGDLFKFNTGAPFIRTDDLLQGSIEDDELLGSELSDELLGDRGDDLLVGGPGNDFYTGGAGRDTFVLEASYGSDRIEDFVDGQDLIELRGGLTYGQLDIIQGDNGTWLNVDSSSELLATLIGVDAHQLSEADFLAV